MDEEDLFDVFDQAPAKNSQSKSTDDPEVVTIEDDNDLEEGEYPDSPVAKRFKANASPADISAKEETVKEDKKEEEEEDEATESVEVALAPRVEIYEISVEGCSHEVVIPSNVTYVPLKERPATAKPAKEYDFRLDQFQNQAIKCIENNQSVLVSAHTSAGKTVVAEYAIAQSLREKQRVVYTTPIKALSNQKYREFYEEFRDVGLITGDVTINQDASCLIMTTEILRLMLFRGSEIMREVGWVVFDEIHYMRDKERGVVWEETIILLPDSVHYVFLSATIPNARQFAEWIAHLHQQTCHVVYTDYRPVPLQHYLYPAGGDGLHLILDENGNFKDENFNLAMSKLQKAGDAAQGDQIRKRKVNYKATESNCLKVIRTIMERDLAPVIVFSFSKKECEVYALSLSKLDFNTSEEKESVEVVFNNAIDVLSAEDKKLPQVEHVLPLLKRGIGIHHGGLLPIIKETIEILFGEGLIKALFATETFAMGLNMPARTVVFTNIEKFDGKDFRPITSGEYIQMSGRAGRRGLDDKGIVILMADNKISPSVGRDLVKGSSDHLNSAFYLTYNMVLNLLRVDDVNPEYMLQHSFYQFQHYSRVPQLQEQIEKLTNDISSITINNEEQVEDYFKVKKQIDLLTEKFLVFIRKPKYILPFLQSGRLIHVVSNEGVKLGWAATVQYKKLKGNKKDSDASDSDSAYTIDVLMPLDASSNAKALIPPSDTGKTEARLVTISLHNISQVSSVRIYLPQDLKNHDEKQSVLKSIRGVESKFNGKVPLLDPVEEMKIKDAEFESIVKKLNNLETRNVKLKIEDDSSKRLYLKKQQLENKLLAVKRELKEAQSLIQMKELKCRKRVLRRLGYCSSSDVIEVKGRVACELTSGDELLLTELLFNGVFNDLSIHQINALLSCFICEEKSGAPSKLSEELQQPLKTLRELAKRIASVSIEAKLEMDEVAYLQKFRPELMDVVYSWSKGASFSQVCKMTDVFEGSIIRCMRRLEELLRQMCQAAKVIGNADLENKFAEADKAIKRDIVFAASLYL